jgi:hypothetical protein
MGVQRYGGKSAAFADCIARVQFCREAISDHHGEGHGISVSGNFLPVDSPMNTSSDERLSFP